MFAVILKNLIIASDAPAIVNISGTILTVKLKSCIAFSVVVPIDAMKLLLK